MGAKEAGSKGSSKRQVGRSTKICFGSTPEKSECMPVTGSHKDMAPSVSP